jgi:uncharacterized phage-associated protein
MIETRNRERLIHALIYFSENSNNAGKTKLFKLLHLLDFTHFEQTGYSVTGLKYKAYDNGPVPEDLYMEWKSPNKDFTDALVKRSKKYASGAVAHKLEPKIEFNDIYFSPYQLDLMEDLGKKYFKHSADQMSKDSHADFGCWDHVYNQLQEPSGDIPYKLALLRRNNEEDRKVAQLSTEYEALIKNYG